VAMGQQRLELLLLDSLLQEEMDPQKFDKTFLTTISIFGEHSGTL